MTEKHARIPAKTFVPAWNAARDPEEVSQKFGISVESACKRASFFRRQGHALKVFPRGPQPEKPEAGKVTVRFEIPQRTARILDALAALAGMSRGAWLAQAVIDLAEGKKSELRRFE